MKTSCGNPTAALITLDQELNVVKCNGSSPDSNTLSRNNINKNAKEEQQQADDNSSKWNYNVHNTTQYSLVRDVQDLFDDCTEFFQCVQRDMLPHKCLTSSEFDDQTDRTTKSIKCHTRL